MNKHELDILQNFKNAFYFSAKMSRKLSLPTDLKPDLGK